MPDSDDFDVFYATSARRVLHHVYAVCGDLAEAQDLTQEAYARAWLKWPQLMLRCFIDAVRVGRPALLTVTGRTVEGDPVINGYAGRPDGRVEHTVDSRQDRYSSGGVLHLICTGPFIEEYGWLGFTECKPR